MLSEEPKRPEIEEVIRRCLSDNYYDDPRTADGVTSLQIEAVIEKLQKARFIAEQREYAEEARKREEVRIREAERRREEERRQREDEWRKYEEEKARQEA